MCFTSDGLTAYVAAMEDSSISWFSRNAQSGGLTFLGKLTFALTSCMSLIFPLKIVISQNGKFVYILSAEECIAWFNRNLTSGALSLAGEIKNLQNGISGLQDPENMMIFANNSRLMVTGNNGATLLGMDTATGSLSFVENIGGFQGNFIAKSSDEKNFYISAFSGAVEILAYQPGAGVTNHFSYPKRTASAVNAVYFNVLGRRVNSDKTTRDMAAGCYMVRMQAGPNIVARSIPIFR